jgi:hypothetical protein
LLTNDGGFGGGVRPLTGLESGGGAGGAEGRAIGGADGRVIGGGVASPEVGSVTFDVSFFGVMPAVSVRFTRTVSRLATGVSPFGGSVMRIVSFLSGSSLGAADGVGFSSAMAWWWERFAYLSASPQCQLVCLKYAAIAGQIAAF